MLDHILFPTIWTKYFFRRSIVGMVLDFRDLLDSVSETNFATRSCLLKKIWWLESNIRFSLAVLLKSVHFWRKIVEEIWRHVCSRRGGGMVHGRSSKFGANCRKLLFFCLLWQRGHWCGKVYFADLNLSEMGNEDRSILAPLHCLTRGKRAACVSAV